MTEAQAEFVKRLKNCRESPPAANWMQWRVTGLEANMQLAHPLSAIDAAIQIEEEYRPRKA